MQMGMKALKYGLTFKDVPEYLQCPHINRGYRLGGSYSECFRSLFRMHNETLNAWTMIAGTCLSLTAVLLACTRCPMTSADKACFALFFMSNCCHMPFSVGYHLFLCMDETRNNMWKQLDVSMIFSVSVLLTFCVSYYSFFGNPWMYLGMTAISLTVAGVAVFRIHRSFKPGQKLNAKMNAVFVGFIILAYCFPMWTRAVLSLLYDSDPTFLILVLVVSICLGVGGYCYAFHLPESKFPGRFDYLVSCSRAAALLSF
jgi:adiponectin receptor